MAPRFRTRIATGLLVVAAVLPVPVAATTATAADQRATPVDRTPDLAGSGGPFGGSARDSAPREHRVDEGRGQTGRPGTPHRPQVPDTDADALLEIPGLSGLPDHFPGFPDRSSQDRDDVRGHGPRHQHPWDPSGQDADALFPPSSGPAWGGLPPEGSRPERPASSGPAHESGGSAASGGSGGDARATAPHSPAHSPKAPAPSGAPSARTAPSPTAAAPAAPPKRTPSHRPSEHAGGSGKHSSERMPEDGDAVSEEPGSARDAAEAGPGAETPYSLDAPAARVERVLPMGAGLALTGLGLAFLGLRLRRG